MKRKSVRKRGVRRKRCKSKDPARAVPARHVKSGPSTRRDPILKERERDASSGKDGLLYRKASIQTRSIDEKARTVEIAFSSETRDVETYSWELGSAVPEILSHAESAVDLSPLLDAGSILRCHDSTQPVAVPREAAIDPVSKRGRAVIHFPEGDPDSEREWLRVRTGLVRGVSVGYSIQAQESVKAGGRSNEGHEGPCIVATKWSVHEISLTPVPADSTVGVGRNKKAAQAAHTRRKGIMDPKLIQAMVRAAGLSIRFADKLIARELSSEEAVLAAIKTELESRKRSKRKRDLKPGPDDRMGDGDGEGDDGEEDEEDDGEGDDGEEDDGEGDDGEEDDGEGDDGEEEVGRGRKPRKRKRSKSRRSAALRERQRCLEIRSAVKVAKLDSEVADELVRRGVTIARARAVILKRMADRDEGAVGGRRIQAGADRSDKLMRHLTVNLGRRAFAASGLEAEDEETKKVERAHVTLIGLAREWLNLVGVPGVRNMSPREVFSSALNPRNKIRAASTVSGDLANALSNLQGKALMKAFFAAKPTWRSWARKGSLPDFKISPRVQLSDFAQLRETGENGEILDSKLSDRAENNQLAIYARRISMTLQMFINDDLDALGRLPAMMGKSAAQLPSRLIYTHLLALPTMSDGVALFHANHNNLLTGAGSNLDASNKVSALSAALKTFRKQTAPQAPNDTEFVAETIDIEPRILLVPPEHEYHSNSLVNPNLFQADSGAGMFAGKFQVEVEPRLSNTGYAGSSTTAWYLAAAASDADNVEVAFLDGNEAPITSSWEDFKSLSLQFRAWIACGVKALDWRGMVKSDGA